MQAKKIHYVSGSATATACRRDLLTRRELLLITENPLAVTCLSCRALSADTAAEDADLPECLGHPAGPFDPMGQTVTCDGSCAAAVRP